VSLEWRVSSDSTRVVVVRHGETEWSAARRHTGRSDPSLTPTGRDQAKQLADVLQGLEVERVLTSPLARARETCSLAGFADRATVCDDLCEWDYGDYEGLTFDEIRAQAPTWNLWLDGCPGGESPAQVRDRADRAIEALIESGPATSLAFAHGHILRMLAARWVSLEAAGGARLMLATAAIGVLGHERQTRTVERWNMTVL
jgi:broad specificity phosphatase PhoE